MAEDCPLLVRFAVKTKQIMVYSIDAMNLM